MMKNKLRPLILVALLVAAAGGGYWAYRRNPDALAQLELRLGIPSEAQAREAQAVSGYIEADDVDIAAQTGGRITRINADEGDYVKAGQVLVTLDTALLDAQMQQAEAKVAAARAQLAKAKAGVRAEDIASAEAAVAVAQAKATAAYTRRQDAIRLRDNPQELDMQIDAATTAAELAKLKIDYSVPLKDASEAIYGLGQQNWEEAQTPQRACGKNPITGKKICKTIDVPEGAKQDASVAWNYAGADEWGAWVDLNSAVAEQKDAGAVLQDLLRLKNDPQQAQLEVVQAEAAYQTAQAGVGVAQRQLETLKAGPRAEQVAVAEAQLKQAEAGLAALKVRRDQHTLVAPLSGWAVERPAHQGEMAAPGQPLLTLADLSRLTLTVYVPEPEIGRVSIGQVVPVLVDTFPDQPFAGRVTSIGDRAEFTPKNVQTRQERADTVFAVKITLHNPDLRLKPGMPADAILSGGPQS
jgi:HlyD family secretion protein